MVKVNFSKTSGVIKPMHAVGQPPLLGADTTYFRYLSEANIPYSRLHDVGGMFANNLYVDIPNIFRDFDADENDPASYDFTFTDLLVSALVKENCEPVYRLGVTIENYHYLRAYRIFPPTDYEKWARICEHIIRHYNEGWADGFHYHITYWEIWNEPDGHPDIAGNEMWKGTPEQYYDLYRVASKHLRACFGNSIKIGGYASCGFYRILKEQTVSGEAFGKQEELTDWDRRCIHFMQFFDGFLDMVAKEKLPLDFFSYHSYAKVADNIVMQAYVEKRLADAGISAEIHLNEWNTNPRPAERGTAAAAANAAALMCAMQNTKMSMMCYYDARIGTSVYGGLFHPMSHQPLCTYYAFKAFGQLYALGKQAALTCEETDLYALAATDGEKKGVLIANLADDREVTTNLDAGMTVYLIDDTHSLEPTDLDPKKFLLKKHQVAYIG